MHQGGTWHGDGPWSRPHCASQLPSPKRGQSPQFSAHFYCGQTAGCIMPLVWSASAQATLWLCVRWGPSYPQKKGTPTPPNFWPMSCGQTAGWMKTPLGTEVDLGPGHFVLDGFPAIPPFRPMSIVTTVAHLSYCWALVDKVTDANKLAAFYCPRCRFRFIVNPNLDSLANRIVWIRGCCRKWHHCYSFTYVIICCSLPVSLVNPRQNGFAGFTNPDSGSRTEWTDDRFAESNLNTDSDSANRIRP